MFESVKSKNKNPEKKLALKELTYGHTYGVHTNIRTNGQINLQGPFDL